MYTIVYSPVAGGGRGERTAKLLSAHMDREGIPHRMLGGEHPGHPMQLARQAAQGGAQTVIAVGGDGTVAEVARGLLGTETALGLIPGGTGNDFRRTFDIPGDATEALERILAGRRIQVDVGQINDEAIFINEASTGFDVSMDHHLVNIKRRLKVKGQLSFLLAVLRTILEYPFPRIGIRVEGEAMLWGNPMLVTVANGKTFGGGMKLNPLADPQDGLFEIMFVHQMPRWRVPLRLPLLISGKLARNPERYPYATMWKAREVELDTGGLPLLVDGTLFPVEGKVRIGLHPKKLWLQV